MNGSPYPTASGSLDLPPAALAWVQSAISPGARVTAAAAQGGATSSTLFRLEVQDHGRSLPLMLRLFTNRAWLAEEPDAPRREAASLQKVLAADVPTPELVASDPDGAQAGLPAVLMTCLPGSVELLPADFNLWLRRMAEALLPIHAIDPAGFPWRYRPYFDLARLAPPTWSRQPALWERAIEIAYSPPPDSPGAFIHRDYHPVNVLWQEGRISGVVDWPNACCGPSGFDVSWCRLNLALLHGPHAARRFLSLYRSAAGGRDGFHPYWDILSILEVLPGPPDVYPPWEMFGIQGLNPALMLSRGEAYLAAVIGMLA